MLRIRGQILWRKFFDTMPNSCVRKRFVTWKAFLKERNLNDAGKKFKDKTEKQDYFLTAILSCLIIFYFCSFLLLKFGHRNRILEILFIDEYLKPFLKKLSNFQNVGNGFN